MGARQGCGDFTFGQGHLKIDDRSTGAAIDCLKFIEQFTFDGVPMFERILHGRRNVDHCDSAGKIFVDQQQGAVTGGSFQGGEFHRSFLLIRSP